MSNFWITKRKMLIQTWFECFRLIGNREAMTNLAYEAMCMENEDMC